MTSDACLNRSASGPRGGSIVEGRVLERSGLAEERPVGAGARAAAPRRATSRLVAPLFLASLLFGMVGGACSRGGSTDGASPAVAGGAVAPSAGEGSGAPAPGEEVVAAPTEDAGTAAVEREQRLPDLVALMRAEGWPDATAAELLEFVPVPPGAEGHAGIFGREREQVRVALILYANERFARPHVTDVEERRRVVADLPEAVARSGRLVVHVRASSRGDAEALAARLMDRVERTR